MLDRVPAWLRHLLIVAGASFAVDWVPVLKGAVDLAAVSTASAAAALWLTPITRSYGVGKGK